MIDRDFEALSEVHAEVREALTVLVRHIVATARVASLTRDADELIAAISVEEDGRDIAVLTLPRDAGVRLQWATRRRWGRS